MDRWILGICSVRFDLEIGQTVEECFPPNVLSPEEELDVAFSSFPDSMSSIHNRASLQDTLFFFRIKRRGKPPGPPAPSSAPRARASSPNENTLSTPTKVQGGASPESSGRTDTVFSSNVPKSGQSWSAGTGRKVNRFRSPPDSPSNAPEALPTPQTSTPPASTHEPDSPFLYGYVFNRQRQDERLKRGGDQRSVVVLAFRPFSSVFRPLVQVAGSHYFDAGTSALRQLASLVSSWPCPSPGTIMDLPLGSSVLRVPIPPIHTLPPPMPPIPAINPSRSLQSLPVNCPNGPFHESDIFGIFRGVLVQLWLLWELVLLGEPLLVLAPTVSQCSEAVAALISLISPLPFSGDFRPYFTIHDPDFPSLAALGSRPSPSQPASPSVPPQKPPHVILGVTNLFFLKALKSFPHVLSVGDASNGVRGGDGGKLRANSQAPATSLVSPLLPLNISPLRRLSGALLRGYARAKGEGPLSLMTCHREAIWTNHDAAVKADAAVLNRLVDNGAGSPDSLNLVSSASLVNNEMLRKHFFELTSNFLAPFSPFFRAGCPGKGLSPFQDPPRLPLFEKPAFLASLAERGPGKFIAKRFQPGKWLELYRSFLEGPNFVPWFEFKRREAESEQRALWRAARERADIGPFLLGLADVELLETFSVIEDHILLVLEDPSSGPAVHKLRSDLRSVFQRLPRDSQQVLLFDPQHAQLLQGSVAGRQALPGRPSLSRSANAGGSGRGIRIRGGRDTASEISSADSSPSASFRQRAAAGATLLADEEDSIFPQTKLEFDDVAEGEGSNGARTSEGYQKAFKLSTRGGRGRLETSRKARSTPNSPFAYSTLSKLFDFSPRSAAAEPKTALPRMSQSLKDGTLSSSLDPNPFNPLF